VPVRPLTALITNLENNGGVVPQKAEKECETRIDMTLLTAGVLGLF
jgi:hypothetical protein